MPDSKPSLTDKLGNPAIANQTGVKTMLVANGKTLVLIPASGKTFNVDFFNYKTGDYDEGTSTPLFSVKLMGWKSSDLARINVDIIVGISQRYALDMPDVGYDPVYFDSLDDVRQVLLDWLEQDFDRDFWEWN